MALFYCPFHLFLLFSALNLITKIEGGKEKYNPGVDLEFPSNRDILGKNVQYEIELFTPDSKFSQNSCNYTKDRLVAYKTVGPFKKMMNITYFFPFTEPLYSSLLCFQVTPFKPNENCTSCIYHVNFQTFNLTGDSGVNASALYMYHHCSFWSFKSNQIRLTDAESGWNLELYFQVNDMFKQCFQKFEVQFCHWKMWVPICDPTEYKGSCRKYPSVVDVSEKSADTLSVKYSGTEPGYYCMIIEGKHSTCSPNDYGPWCRQKHTLIKNISAIVEEVVGESKSNKNPSRYWITLVCGIAVIIITVSLVGASLYYYYFVVKRRPPSSPSDSTFGSDIENSDDEKILCNIDKKQKEITIIYTQETPEILEAIRALGNFLRRCCNLTVRIDVEDEANARMNPFGWYSRGDFFIIVETDGAVYREQACIANKDVCHVDGDFLDPYFVSSLVRIIHNPDSLVDYSKYLVVHFSFTPSHQCFQTVALSKRYVISQHLAQLCHFITHGEDMIPSTKNLLRFAKKWEGNETLKTLNSAITKASKFMSQNPNYVKHFYKERSMSVSDTDDDQTQML